MDENTKCNLAELEKNIGYKFENTLLLRVAVTHSSYSNETSCNAESNERLEFLGDAVLDFYVAEELFRRFELREGELTQMRASVVNRQAFAYLAGQIDLASYLILGRGEENQGGRTRAANLANAFEALAGAIFLDAGYEKFKDVAARLVAPLLDEIAYRQKVKDYKTLLQETFKQRFKTTPVYSLHSISGPEHDKTFEVLLLVPTGEKIVAAGPSLKLAEQNAAKLALDVLLDPLPL